MRSRPNRPHKSQLSDHTWPKNPRRPAVTFPARRSFKSLAEKRRTVNRTARYFTGHGRVFVSFRVECLKRPAGDGRRCVYVTDTVTAGARSRKHTRSHSLPFTWTNAPYLVCYRVTGGCRRDRRNAGKTDGIVALRGRVFVVVVPEGVVCVGYEITTRTHLDSVVKFPEI